jgi:heat-inducible transcriptional repressor
VDNQVYSAGLQYLLQNPEFRETEQILPLIRLIEDNRQMFSFLKNLEFQAKKHIVLLIGKEHFWGSFAPYTTVAGYFSNASQRGWVTVFGPTRMHYNRNIATLDQLSTELSVLETLFIEE